MGNKSFAYSYTMKNLLLISVASTLLLVQLAESIFLGPVGVGLAVGAILAKKGFLLGAAIANRRSRGHRRYSRSRHSYRPSYHYKKPSYHYSQPDAYYYSSSKNHGHHHHRGKRSILPDMTNAELHRLRREVDNFNLDNWLEEMSTKDQDTCGKKLACELSAKLSRDGQTGMTTDEILLAEIFSQKLDVEQGQIEFTVAGQVGIKGGQPRCKALYKRCDTSLEELLDMINTELKEMDRVQLEIEGLTEEEIQAEIDAEQEENNKLLEEAGLDTDRLWEK